MNGAVPTVPTRTDFQRALSTEVLHQWRMRLTIAGERAHRTREERRSLQAAQRERKMSREALAAFATAGVGRQRVLLVRHGEAQHNAQWCQHSSTADTRLTECGRRQALALASHPALVQCTLLVVSPLSRAIETAVAIFGEACHALVYLCPLCSERRDSGAPCNEGSAKSSLACRFPFVRGWHGFDELPDDWCVTPEADAHDCWRTQRVPAFLAWLRRRAEERIVVVGHGGFFSDERLAGRMLANCEMAVMRTTE